MRNCPAHCNLISEHNNHQGSYAERTFKLITCNSKHNANSTSILHRFVVKTVIFSFLLSFFLSFLWLINQTQALADTMLRFLGHTDTDTDTHTHTHTHTHTQQDSSEWVISSSQGLLCTQHTTNTSYKHPCPQQDSDARFLQSSDCKPMP